LHPGRPVLSPPHLPTPRPGSCHVLRHRMARRPRKGLKMALFRRHTRQCTATNTTGQEQTRQVTLASATLVGRTQIRRTATATDWQDEIWGYYDTVGELRYACRWLANAISRCTLFIGQTPDGTAEPTPAELEDRKSVV